MRAYLAVNLTVKDPEGCEQYKAAVPAVIAKHGGEYLVRGKSEVIEGTWQPNRLVIIRFPNLAGQTRAAASLQKRNRRPSSLSGCYVGAAAKAFLNDPEYQPVKSLRTRAAHSDMVVVEGV